MKHFFSSFGARHEAPVRAVTSLASPSVPCPETRLVEFGSAAVALWWALLLLLPVHLFRTNAAFHSLPRLGPEWAWGVFSLAVGLLQSVAALRRRPLLRWLGLFLSAMLWGGLCACLACGCPRYFALPVNTGCGCYGVMVVLANVSAILLTPYVLADLLIWMHRLRLIWMHRLRTWLSAWMHRRSRGG